MERKCSFNTSYIPGRIYEFHPPPPSPPPHLPILTHTIHQAWEVHMKLSDMLSKLSVVKDEMLPSRCYQPGELSSGITSETTRSLLPVKHIS